MDPTPQQLASLMKLLAAPARVQIVQLLKGRTLCVNALAARLGITQGAVSQHLRVMRDSGLVAARKRGYYVHYRLEEKALAKWREAVGRLLDPAAEPTTGPKGAAECVIKKTRPKAARNPST